MDHIRNIVMCDINNKFLHIDEYDIVNYSYDSHTKEIIDNHIATCKACKKEFQDLSKVAERLDTTEEGRLEVEAFGKRLREYSPSYGSLVPVQSPSGLVGRRYPIDKQHRPGTVVKFVPSAILAFVSSAIITAAACLIIIFVQSDPFPATATKDLRRLPMPPPTPIAPMTPFPATATKDLRRLQRVELALSKPLAIDAPKHANYLDYLRTSNEDVFGLFEELKTRKTPSLNIVVGSFGLGKTRIIKNLGFKKLKKRSDGTVQGSLVDLGLDSRAGPDAFDPKATTKREHASMTERLLDKNISPKTYFSFYGEDGMLLESRLPFLDDDDVERIVDLIFSIDSRILVVDSIDEVHPDSSYKILRSLQKRILMHKNNTIIGSPQHIVVFGRPEAFKRYLEDTKGGPELGNIDLSNIYELKPIRDYNSPAFVLSAIEDYRSFKATNEGPRASALFEGFGDKTIELLKSSAYRGSESILGWMSLGNFFFEAIRSGDTDVDKVIDDIFSSQQDRAEAVHDRPASKIAGSATYISLLRKVAERKASQIDDNGFFPVNNQEFLTYPIQRDGATVNVKVKIADLLRYSGLVQLKLEDHTGQSRFRFEPFRLHRWLIESKQTN